MIDFDDVLDELGQFSPQNKDLKAEKDFDLENSDDLNRIISKYETMLSQDAKKPNRVPSKAAIKNTIELDDDVEDEINALEIDDDVDKEAQQTSPKRQSMR